MEWQEQCGKWVSLGFGAEIYITRSNCTGTIRWQGDGLACELVVSADSESRLAEQVDKAVEAFVAPPKAARAPST